MEDLVMAYNQHFKVTTARFANVAFSNGSLPDGWMLTKYHATLPKRNIGNKKGHR